MGYENGKIYKITGSGLTYYGSTIRLLSQRKTIHKYGMDTKSKEIIEKGDWKIELVEDFSCENKQQLLWRERWYIDNNECINKQRPIITKEEVIIRQAHFYNINKNIINEENRVYYQLNKDRIKEQHKAYRLANLDKIRERDRARRKIKPH
jgi:hypothetical protein